MVALIEIKDLHKTYTIGDMKVPVLRGVSLSIEKGDYLALMGASGSGKSTLMNILGFLDQPTSGSYFLDGQDMSHLNAASRARIRNERTGFVFQNFNLLKRTTALENVLLPLQYSNNIKFRSRKDANEYAIDALKRVGLADRLDHTPVQLSGGQQQRVAIARALINNPSIVFADEPTGNLDSHSSKEIMQILQDINNTQGVTVIMVTHDAHVAKQAKRVIHMQDGLLEASDSL